MHNSNIKTTKAKCIAMSSTLIKYETRLSWKLTKNYKNTLQQKHADLNLDYNPHYTPCIIPDLNLDYNPHYTPCIINGRPGIPII